ncbi:Aminopeptidase 2 [Fusarium albosuccineum]|uniref:Aminopeptidase 2 n=1 Tax=Fusarium albosuccineum TaxID=1237068 RepID=A0A8H4KPG1_9HYPO|nr:Aminopeptidase 2 [Fusarium albosuccineum]
MVLDNLGEDKFFQGLKLYLRRHQYQCTESDDLWRAWEEVTGEPVATNMRVWTKEPGFPVLKVPEQSDESGKVTGIHLLQQRFLASGTKNQDNDPSSPIYPLRFAFRSDTGVEIIDMNCREMVIAPPKGFFKVNADRGGFFRTSYSPELLERVLEGASKGNLSLRDCVGLSCDLKALVAAGLNKTSELLDLNLKFRKIDSFYVWEMIDRNLRSIQSVYKFHGPELNEALRKLTLDVLSPKAQEFGWSISENDEEVLVTFKTSMFSGAGLAGDEKIVSAAKELFAKRMAGDESVIPGSLRWELFGIVAAHEGLRKLWETSSNEDEQYLALECLGRAPNGELMKWVLELLLTETVKNHDMFYLTWLAGSTTHAAIELWEWTKKNWSRVEKAVPVDILSLFLGTALDGLHSEEQIQDVRTFFATRNTENCQMILDQKLEAMENRRSWAERDVSDVRSWLEAHGYL